MAMGRARALVLAATLMTSACGTYVPQLKNPPFNWDDKQNNGMVAAILASVRCELRNAVTVAVDNDLLAAQQYNIKRYSDFLNDWGAQVALTLTIIEQSSARPSVNLLPPYQPSSIFSISGGIGLDNTAKRIEKINTFYTIKELYLRKGEKCTTDKLDPSGSFLIRNELHTADILAIKIDEGFSRGVNAPAGGQKNVISHEVSFQTVFDGNITPTWKLVRATINPQQFLSVQRDQTHDLLVTFGPLDKPAGGKSLVAIAQQSHIASQTSADIANAIRGNR